MSRARIRPDAQADPGVTRRAPFACSGAGGYVAPGCRIGPFADRRDDVLRGAT